jgi:hypothetical protein
MEVLIMGDIIHIDEWKRGKEEKLKEAYLPDAQLIYSVDGFQIYSAAPVDRYDFAVMEQRSNDSNYLVPFFYPDFDW